MCALEGINIQQTSDTPFPSHGPPTNRRQVRRPVNFYNLDMILSVGYRVNTRRGTQFRIWATQRLREYQLRGYVAHEIRRAVVILQHPAPAAA